MPSYSKETEQYHIERVREMMALKPSIGAIAIKRVLENDPEAPLNLHHDYILKLKKKIKAERQHRFDQAKVEERLAEIQDRTESVVAQMWRMLLDQSAPEVARVGAAKTILDAEHKLLEAQMSAGIFERKLGTVDVRHTHELAQEHKVLVIQFLRNHGVIKQNPEFAELPDGAGSGKIAGQPIVQG